LFKEKKKERERELLVSVASIVTMSVITMSVIPGSSGAWGTPIAKFGVGTVTRKMTTLSALIASHARIKATASTASSSRFGNGHTNASTTDFLAIDLPLGFFGVFPVSKDHKGKAWHRPGHPDLFQRSILAKELLQIPLASLTVQISHMKPVTIVGICPIESITAAVGSVTTSPWTVRPRPA